MGSVGRHSIGIERLEKLAEQKRIAVGRRITRFGEDWFDARAQAVPHDFFHRRRRERPGREHLRVRLAGQLLQDCRIGLRLRRPHARHERDGQVLEPPRQVGEEPQRGPVAPMEVVHREHQRAL